MTRCCMPPTGPDQRRLHQRRALAQAATWGHNHMVPNPPHLSALVACPGCEALVRGLDAAVASGEAEQITYRPVSR